MRLVRGGVGLEEVDVLARRGAIPDGLVEKEEGLGKLLLPRLQAPTVNPKKNLGAPVGPPFDAPWTDAWAHGTSVVNRRLLTYACEVINLEVNGCRTGACLCTKRQDFVQLL